MKAPVSIGDLRVRAQRRLPRMVFDFLEGGAGDERGLEHNRAALDRLFFVPRRLVDVSRRDLATRMFGKVYPLPLAIAPTGLNGLYCADADLVLAKVAASYGIPFCLSSASTSSIEDVARAGEGEKWFQLYVLHQEQSRIFTRRARDAGYSVLVLTVDVPVNGNRPRDARNGFKVPFKMTPRLAIDFAMHPRWSLGMMRRGAPQLANFATDAEASTSAQAALLNRQMDASFDWAAFDRLRQDWPGTLIVKGLHHPDDIAKARAAGADAVILSNHGARQLEDILPPITALLEMEPPSGFPLLVDSGIRSGTDVIKAIAAGAGLCLLGRPVLYGLASDGERGVRQALDLVIADMDRTLALIGVPNLRDLDRTVLQRTGPWSRR